MEYEQNDENTNWSDTYEFRCIECRVRVDEWEYLCNRCATTNVCHCGVRTESLKTFLCAECSKEQTEWERRQIVMLLDVHLLRAFWWQHCWDVIAYHFVDPIRRRIVLLRKKFFERK